MHRGLYNIAGENLLWFLLPLLFPSLVVLDLDQEQDMKLTIEKERMLRAMAIKLKGMLLLTFVATFET